MGVGGICGEGFVIIGRGGGKELFEVGPCLVECKFYITFFN